MNDAELASKSAAWVWLVVEAVFGLTLVAVFVWFVVWLPTPREPYRLSGLHEAEQVDQAGFYSTLTTVRQTDRMRQGAWSGGQYLDVKSRIPGDRIRFVLPHPGAGEFNLFGFFTKGPPYGVVSVRNEADEVLGQALDLYSSYYTSTGGHFIARFAFTDAKTASEDATDGAGVEESVVIDLRLEETPKGRSKMAIDGWLFVPRS